MSDDTDDRTASLMTPAKLAQLKTRPRPAATPAAWLDQLASDAGSGHVRRLLDLRKLLEAQLHGRDGGALAAALAAFGQAVQQLDFALLQPRGWLARATGRGKQQAASFAAQAEHVGRAGEDFTDELRQAHKQQQGHAAVDRTLLELDVELRAIEKIMDQGARWLQDMRNQLKARQAQPGDAATQQQIREDSARCELLLARLKALRAASSPAQQAAQHFRAALASRDAVLQSLQRIAQGEWPAWQRALAPLAAPEGGGATRGLEQARALQQPLQRALEQAGPACQALAGQEQALAEELAALQAPLQAAA